MNVLEIKKKNTLNQGHDFDVIFLPKKKPSDKFRTP